MFNRVRDGVRRLFRLKIHEPRLARADAETELREYLRARVEQLTAQGMTTEAAHAEALRRLGGSFERALDDAVQSAEQREKEMSFREYLGDLQDDLRFALRSFRREKLIAAFIVLTLALGIGANAAMYGVVDRLLIRGPEHIAEREQVMRVYRTIHQPVRGDITSRNFGWVSYELLRANIAPAATIAAYTTDQRGLPFGEGADAVLVPIGAATWDFFPMLGVQPALGRFFNDAEDSPTAPQPVVVLGYGLWQRAFDGDSSVLGREITLASLKYTIIGVAPRAFTGPGLQPVDAWTPLSFHSMRNSGANWPTTWTSQWLWLVARVKPGVSPEQVATAATAAYRGAYDGNELGAREAKVWLAPLNATSQGREPSEVAISRWLVGVTLVVLLIACANVANLLLARAVRRRREVAVRIALGAGRGRLIRLLLTESTTLAMAGALAGLVVAWGTAQLMRNVLLPGLEWPNAAVDFRVLGVSIAIASLVGILTGLVPALRASRPDLTAALKAGAREGGGHTARLRGALTIAQAALSIVLLVGAGLFVRSLEKIRAIDLGIQPDRVILMQVRYPTPARPTSRDPVAIAAGNAEVARRTQVMRDAMARARRLASVETSSLSVGLPFYNVFGQQLRVAGWDSIPRLKGGSPNISAVAEGYFTTVGGRLLEGRAFTDADRQGSEPIAIVNKTMASTLWPAKSPLGECVFWGATRDSLNTCSRIVGVVADAHGNSLREDPVMHYYIPFGQEKGFGGTSLLVRPRPGTEAETIGAMRQLLMEIDPTISFVSGGLLQNFVDFQVRPWKLGAAMFSLLGLLALLVAAVGLYSVMSYLVAQRTQEMGVRIALGASAGSIVMLVLRTSGGMALAGIGIGLVTALATGQFIQPLLFETSSRDPVVLGGVAAMLFAIAVLASVVPALRAKRVDPMEALRAE
jgi:predicted permease